MKRLAVYSVQTGRKGDFVGFDLPQSPQYDLILFTDDPTLKAGGCEVRMIDNGGLDAARSSRRPKLMPHKYLRDYEWSIYVDGNSRIKTDPGTILDIHLPLGGIFFAFDHPDRDYLFDEGEHVIMVDYDDVRRVREQLDHYSDIGMPRHAGLITGTVLLRRRNYPAEIALGEEWYEHVLRFSRRDQISFNFVAWRQKYNYGRIAGDIHDNPHVAWPRRPRSERLTADFDPKVYAWLNPLLQQSQLSPEDHFMKQRRSGKQPRYKRHSWTLRKIANEFNTDKGTIYYNTHAYADVYETFLAPMRNKPIKLLEIGLLRHDVQARNPGGPYDDVPSLRMWRRYLRNAQIYGMDVSDFSTTPAIPGVTIVHGDMGSISDVERLLHISNGNFDVIIDDASHASHHQQTALKLLYPHLQSGGLYFIEDLHHQPPNLEIDGLLKTKDLLTALAAGRFLGTKFINASAIKRIGSNLDRIEFYDSWDRTFGRIHRAALAVLKKSKRRKWLPLS